MYITQSKIDVRIKKIRTPKKISGRVKAYLEYLNILPYISIIIN